MRSEGHQCVILEQDHNCYASKGRQVSSEEEIEYQQICVGWEGASTPLSCIKVTGCTLNACPLSSTLTGEIQEYNRKIRVY